MLRLSICLPTYNRAHDCDRTAHTILREINGRWEQIEFIIADNASTDGTRDMVEALPERALIQYVRHGTNSGLVGNYCHCLRAARGEYVWVVGDDDEYHPGVVDKILDVIQTRAPGLIHLNFDFKDGRTGLLAARSYYGWQIVGAVPDSRRTMESMVAIDDGGLMFISMNVMKTALAVKQISRPSFIATLATPLEVTVCCGLEGGFYFVREPLVTGLFNVASWAHLSDELYLWGKPVAWMAMWRRGLRTTVLLRRLVRLANMKVARFYLRSPARLGAVLRRALRG